MTLQACDIPKDGLLQAYVGKGETYTDCFEVMSEGGITLPDFIEAFYTTWLFRLERLVLSATLRKRILDADVRALGKGADSFAAWSVEARTRDQILLCDMAGHTRSYFAVSSTGGGGTRLVFGSAVVAADGQPLGKFITALIPLHKVYSKVLLRQAERKLR